MGSRAEPILPRPLGPPSLRPRRLTTVLRGRGGQPGPTTRGLRRGGLRGSPGLGDGGLRPLGHFPGQGCLRHAGEPPLPGLLDEGGRRVRPAVGLLHGWTPVAEPPFIRLEEVVTKTARKGCLMLIIAPEGPGPQYPWLATLCALCPKRWQLPQDRPVYLRGARTSCQPPGGGPGLSCWTPAKGHRQACSRHPRRSSPKLRPPGCQRRHGPRTREHNSWRHTATQTRCPSGVGPGRWNAGGTCNASTQRGLP